MNAELRRYFDEQLEQVLEQLPAAIRKLLDEVPLYVEDYPSPEVMRKMGVHHRGDLCGLYTGVPLIDRSIEQAPTLSDVVQLFREGILSQASDDDGQLHSKELREQIRITLLHELGHYHGLDEEDLDELGYG